jgi:hypothetical protein
MAEENEADDVMVATRVSKSLYAKISKRRNEIRRLTGIEPSISAVMRAMLEEASSSSKPVRRRAANE